MALEGATGGSGVAQKIVKIFLDPDTIFRLKNRAGTEGRSTSECARRLLESGLENRSGSGTGLDPDSLENLIETVRESALENIPSAAESIALARGIEAIADNLGALRAEVRKETGRKIHEIAGHQSFFQALLVRKKVLVAGMTGLFLGMAIFAGCGWFLFQKGEENGIARSTSMMSTIASLLKCGAPGWKIRTTKEGRICYPFSAKDGVHGWNLP